MTDTEGKLIFVVGNSRSGTTMMGRILGNHSNVFTFHELHFFDQMWSNKDKGEKISFDKSMKILSRLFCFQREGYFSKCANKYKYYLNEAKQIVEHADAGLNAIDIYKEFLFYETSRNGKSIPCEQTPQNVFYIKEILDFFPGARILNMIRDPRDVLLSQKRRWKRPFLSGGSVPRAQTLRYWANYHPITISKLWNSSVAAGSRNAADDRVYTLRFEDLLSDPASHLQRICDFVGIEYAPAMLDVPHIGSSSSHDNPASIGIDRGRIGVWRRGGLNNTELYVSQRITRPYMSQYGYKFSEPVANPILLLFYLITFPLKIAGAFVLSLKRIRNIPEAIRRRLK